MTARTAAEWDGYGPDALASMWGAPRVEAWERIGSTNDRAMELAEDGAPPGTVVLADEQTAGRGRRGSSWISPPGAGLWMSVVLDARRAGAQLPLVVGIACVDAIRACAPTALVSLKWPNDLLIRDLKVGGVLCEASRDVAVAGIGVNVTTPPGGFPEALQGIATSLEVCGVKPMLRNDLAGRVVSALRSRFEPDDPFDAAREDLDTFDALRDRSIETDQAGRGRARGIDERGALVLERPDGSRVRVISGSVRVSSGLA